MSPAVTGLVDKSLVHKTNEDNVFIKNLLREIPDEIERGTVDEIIIPGLSEGSRAFFSEHYHPVQHKNDESIVLYRLMDADYEVRLRLADMLDQVSGFSLPETFRASLNVNTEHPFFFEYPVEHVPGMKLMEAAQQFALACWHQFGHVPVQGWQFVMSRFDTEMTDFTELCYPAEFYGRALELEKTSGGQWIKCLFEAKLVQNGMVRTTHHLQAKIMPVKVFERMRYGRQVFPSAHRFEPYNHSETRLSLWHREGQRYLSVMMINLSPGGFSCSLPAVADNRKLGDILQLVFDAIILLKGNDIIRGEAVCVWTKPLAVGLLAGFRFEPASEADLNNLHRAIRSYCHIIRGHGSS